MSESLDHIRSRIGALGINNEVLELREELELFDEESNESGYASWESFMARWNENLSQCLSPLRTVDIDDMIVEVDSVILKWMRSRYHKLLPH